MPTHHDRRENGQIIGKQQGESHPTEDEHTIVAGHRGTVTPETPHPREPSGININFPFYGNEFRPSHDDVIIKPTDESE